MTLRKKRIVRKSSLESLELRALLSGDGVLPEGPIDPTDPAVSGPAPEIHGEFEGPIDIAAEFDLDSELGNDIHGGVLDETATLLTFDSGFATVSSNIDRDADADVFRFIAPAERTSLDAFGTLPLQMAIHDAAGNVVGESHSLEIDDITDPDGPFLLRPTNAFAETIPGDTYFVSVGSTKGQIGHYQIYLNSVAPPKPPTPDSPLGTDAHADSFENATKLDLDVEPFTQVTSNIDSENDVDVFKISVPEGLLIADTRGFDGEIRVELLAADGRRIPTEEDQLEAVFHHVDEGEYFLRVTGDVGLYQLGVVNPNPIEFLPEPGTPESSGPIRPDAPAGEDAHGDTVNDATKLDLDADIPVASVVSNIDGPTDRDVFAVKADSTGNEITFDVVGLSEFFGLDVQVILSEGEITEGLIDIVSIGADGDVLDPATGSGAQIVEGIIDPEPNQIFFISIGSIGESEGTYNLNVFGHPNDVDLPILVDPVDPIRPSEPIALPVDSPLGQDIHGDTIQTATTGEAGGYEVFSNIDSDNDKDIFYFVGEQRVLYGEAFHAEGGGPLSIRILNESGEPLPQEALFLEVRDSEAMFEGRIDGPFYVEVSGAVGEYSLAVFSEPMFVGDPILPEVDATLGEDVHGDSVDSATKVGLDGDLFTFTSNIDSANDVDVFAVPANELGDEVFFDAFSWLSSEMGLSVSILNSEGSPIEAEIHGDSNFAEGFFDPEVGETLFIAVSANTPGAYTLNVHIPTGPPVIIDPIPVDPEPIDPTDPVDLPIDVEPEFKTDADLGMDLHAPNFEDATRVSLNADGFIDINSNIDEVGDIDVFRMVGTGQRMVAEVGGLGATEMLFKVYGEDGELVAQAIGGELLEFETLADDNYYLSAESTGDPGQYFAWLQPLPPDLPVIEPGLPETPVDPEEPFEPQEPTDPSNVDGGGPGNQDSTTGDNEKLEEDALPFTSDINGDGVLDMDDFLVLSSNYGKDADAVFADGDLTGDGKVDFADFLIMSADFA